MTEDIMGEILFHPDLSPKAVKRISEIIRDLKEKAEEYDALKIAVDWCSENLAEERSRLEAVKKQLVEFPCVHIQDYQRMMRKIEEIVEAIRAPLVNRGESA